MATIQRIFWTGDEWLNVLIRSITIWNKTNEPFPVVVAREQKVVLPPERWRRNIRLHAERDYEYTRVYAEARKKLRLPPGPPPGGWADMPSEEPSAMSTALQEVATQNAEEQTVKVSSGIVWTTLEKARVAREVKRLQDADKAEGRERKLSGLYIMAQALCLPSGRRRTSMSLYNMASTGRLETIYVEGLEHQWLLPVEEAPAAPIELEAQRAQAIDASTEQAVAQAVYTPDAPPAPAAAPIETAAAPPTPAAAPLARMELAVDRFTRTMLGALSELLTTQSDMLAERMASQVGGVIAKAADEIGRHVAAQIAGGLRSTVHDMLEAELGPIPAPGTQAANSTEQPGKAEPEPEEEPAPRVPARERVKIDVVGLLGQQPETVRRALGESFDINFIPTEHAYRSRATPRAGSTLFIMTKAVAHSVVDRWKDFSPVLVQGGPQNVIDLAEQLQSGQQAA